MKIEGHTAVGQQADMRMKNGGNGWDRTTDLTLMKRPLCP